MDDDDGGGGGQQSLNVKKREEEEEEECGREKSVKLVDEVGRKNNKLLLPFVAS